MIADVGLLIARGRPQYLRRGADEVLVRERDLQSDPAKGRQKFQLTISH
jgi:hypothetical protein